MIAQVRRISLIVAFVVAAVSAWTTVAEAAEPQNSPCASWSEPVDWATPGS